MDSDPRYFVHTGAEIHHIADSVAAHQLAAMLSRKLNDSVSVYKYGEGVKPRSYKVGVYHPGQPNSILPVAPTGELEIDAITAELIEAAQQVDIRGNFQTALF